VSAAVTLRQARDGDRAAITAIERASFTDAWPDRSFLALLSQSPEMLWVAEAGGAVVGYWVGRRIGDEAELQNLAVHPDWRGRGIGRALLEDFIATVGGDVDTVIFLEVRASNHAAIALYTAMGFAEIDRRKGYYAKPPEDAVVMARRPGGDG
jgi:ribosomal-protein-alanine N-acetyltransferase